jgi:hypothetical protein
VAVQRHPAQGELARAGARSRRHGDALGLQPVDVDQVGAQALAQRRHGQAQRRLGQAVAGDEGARIEAHGREGVGEGAQRLGPDHVAAEARDLPAGEVEVLEHGGLGAPGRQLVAEGRAGGEGAAVPGDDVEPQHRPAHEGGGRQHVDRHLADHRHQHEADQAHVVVERQPGYGAVEPGRGPGLGERGGVGHQGPLGDRDAEREAGAARGELQITEAFGIGRGQRDAVGLGQVGELAHDLHVQASRGFGEPGGEVVRGEAGASGGGLHHPAHVGDVDILAAERSGQRERHRRQAGVLAGEEGAQEIAVAGRRQRHPVAGHEAGGQQARGHGERLVAQVAIGQHLAGLAAQRMDVEAGGLAGRVVQRLGHRAEAAKAEVAVRRCRSHLQVSFLIGCTGPQDRP